MSLKKQISILCAILIVLLCVHITSITIITQSYEIPYKYVNNTNTTCQRSYSIMNDDVLPFSKISFIVASIFCILIICVTFFVSLEYVFYALDRGEETIGLFNKKKKVTRVLTYNFILFALIILFFTMAITSGLVCVYQVNKMNFECLKEIGKVFYIFYNILISTSAMTSFAIPIVAPILFNCYFKLV